MEKFKYKFIVFVLFSFISLTIKSQTPTLSITSNVSGNQGSAVSVAVNASNFTDLVGFQWTILYDNTKLTYVNCTNWNADIAGGSVIINSSVPGVLRFVYNNYPSAVNISTLEKLFDLNFTVGAAATGMAYITWSDSPTMRELSNSLSNIINATWNDGSVYINAPGAEFRVVGTSGSPGSAVSVVVTAKELTNIVSFQWTLQYDNTKLTFVDVVGWNADVSGAVTINSATPGKITFTRAQTELINITTAENFFIVNFIINSGATGYTDLTWSDAPTARLVKNDLNNPVTTIWTDGRINIVALSPTIEITSTIGTTGGNVAVPVKGQSLTDVAGFQWTLDYDETKLTYVNCSDFNVDMVTGSTNISIVNDAINGKLMIAYNSDVSTINITTQELLFNINFNIINGQLGLACFEWQDSPTPREVSNSVPEALSVYWNTGCVTIELPSYPTISLEGTTGVAGAIVNMAVTGEDIKDMVAFQWTIDYDQTKLIYLGCSDWNTQIQLGVGNVNISIVDDPVAGKLMMAYNNINSKISISTKEILFNLNFTIKPDASGSACNEWSDSPTLREVSTDVPTVLSVTWINGCVIAILDKYSWIGVVSSDWQTTGNWYPPQLPNINFDALIPAGCPNYPVINNGTTTAECKNLQIDIGASVTVAPNGQMTVGGTLTNSVGTTGLIVKSDATGTGSLILNNATVAATCERYLAGSKWHFVMSPLDNAESDHFRITSYGATNPNFRIYKEPSKDYWNATMNYTLDVKGWTKSTTTKMSVDSGYVFYSPEDRTYSLDGGNLFYHVNGKTFNGLTYTQSATGNVTVPVLGSVPWTNYDGWNIIGNPYTCNVDWDAVVSTPGALTNVENGIYYYDGGVSKYKFYGAAAKDWGIPAISINGGSNIIPENQAFFVKLASAGTGSVRFPLSTRTHNNSTYYKMTEEEIMNILSFRISIGELSDETVLRSSSFATDDRDRDIDVYKVFSWDNTVPQIYTLSDFNDLLMINTIATVNASKDVKVGTYFSTAGEYTISFTNNTFNDYKVVLEDKEMEKFIPVSSNTEYKFICDKGTYNDRFVLHFNQSTTVVDDPADNPCVIIYPNPAENETLVQSQYNITDIKVYTLTGKLMLSEKVSSNQTTLKLHNFTSGVYLVNIIETNGNSVQKKLVIMK